MSANISRRWFIGGLASFGAFGGNRIFRAHAGTFSGGKPNLTFGVVSDVHVRLAASREGFDKGHDTSTFIHTLEWFRAQGVDAVMIVGDIADKGLVDELQYVADAWFKVFPNDKAPDGRHVQRLFVYGNHDYEGFGYGGYAKKLWPDETERVQHVLRANQKANWEKIFNEPFAPIMNWEVNGYTFVGGQWTADKCRGKEETGIAGVEEFFAANRNLLDPKKPFFYFQHPHPKDTCYGNWAWGHDDGRATRALSAFPNAIAFSGHSHTTLTHDQSIWQGAFTSLGTSSLRYTGASSSTTSRSATTGCCRSRPRSRSPSRSRSTPSGRSPRSSPPAPSFSFPARAARTAAPPQRARRQPCPPRKRLCSCSTSRRRPPPRDACSTTRSWPRRRTAARR